MVLIIKKKIKNTSPQISLHRAEDCKDSIVQRLVSAGQSRRPWAIAPTRVRKSLPNCINFMSQSAFTPIKRTSFPQGKPSGMFWLDQVPHAHIFSSATHPVILPHGTWHTRNHLFVIICLITVFFTRLKASRRGSGPFYSQNPLHQIKWLPGT